MMLYAFYWDIGMMLAGNASLCQRHLPSNPVGIVLWKLRVGNWKLCLICIWWGLTDVSFELLPRRFPFGQALAEALKTNASVTSIDLHFNSIGDEGVKACCVPGFQVAVHGVFVTSFLEGFVVCSCSSITFPGFQILVDCQWSGWIAFWLELILCGMMWYAFYWAIGMILAWYWHDIGWKCISVSNDIRLESSGNGCLETRSRKLRVVSPLYFMRSRRCQPWSTSESLSLWPGTGWSFDDEHFRDKHWPCLGTIPSDDEGVKAFCVPGIQVAAHGASAYSWCWGSDSDPDWRVLRVLRASAVGDVIVPSSKEKSTAHSQALKQVIEEKKKMGFELRHQNSRDLSWAELVQKSTPSGCGGTVCLLLSVRDLHVYCLIMIIFDWSRAPATCEMPQCTAWSFFDPKIDRLGISTWNGDRNDFCGIPNNPQKTIPNLWFIIAVCGL